MNFDQSNFNRNIFIPGILEVRTNKKNLVGFKYGSNPYLCNNINSSQSKIIIYYFLNNRIKAIENSNKQLKIIKKLPFGISAEAIIDITEVKRSKLLANRNYEIWSNLRGTCAFERPEDILSELATAEILSANLTPLHCACIDSNGKGILIIAPSNTGKTFTTFKLVQEHGFNFVAEDIAVSDGKNIYGCHFTATDVPFHINKRRLSLRNKLKQVFFPNIEKKRLVDYISKDRLINRTSISRIVFLKKGKNNISNISKEIAKKWITRSNMMEFNYRSNRSLLALWDRYGYPDIIELDRVERKLLGDLINNSDDIICISSLSIDGFAEQFIEVGV
jgi:hypothetical protein